MSECEKTKERLKEEGRDKFEKLVELQTQMDDKINELEIANHDRIKDLKMQLEIANAQRSEFDGKNIVVIIGCDETPMAQVFEAKRDDYVDDVKRIINDYHA